MNALAFGPPARIPPRPVPVSAEDLLRRLGVAPAAVSPLVLGHLQRVLRTTPVTSDALLQLADMAQEVAQAWWALPARSDYRQLADLLRTAAPAFAAVPLPSPDQEALPARTLRIAADCLMASRRPDVAGAERILRRMADEKDQQLSRPGPRDWSVGGTA